MSYLISMVCGGPHIFDYFDYRKYLSDYYQWRKSVNAYFSFRYISKVTGVDHALLVKMFQGQRHLSVKNISKFCSLLNLNKKSAEYFEILVYYGRAKTDREIKKYFEELLRFSRVGVATITKDKYEFYQKWYYTAMLQVLHFTAFDGNYQKLGEMLVPPITPSEAKKTVRLLEKLELIKKDKQGGYKLTSTFITTGDKWRSVAIKAYQDDTLELARRALREIPKQNRDFSTLSLSIDRKGLDMLKELVIQFQKQAFDIAEKCGEVDRAYQVNMQIFPLSKTLHRGEK